MYRSTTTSTSATSCSYTNVHQCTPMYTNAHQCTPMYTNVQAAETRAAVMSKYASALTASARGPPTAGAGAGAGGGGLRRETVHALVATQQERLRRRLLRWHAAQERYDVQ